MSSLATSSVKTCSSRLGAGRIVSKSAIRGSGTSNTSDLRAVVFWKYSDLSVSGVLGNDWNPGKSLRGLSAAPDARRSSERAFGAKAASRKSSTSPNFSSAWKSANASAENSPSRVSESSEAWAASNAQARSGSPEAPFKRASNSECVWEDSAASPPAAAGLGVDGVCPVIEGINTLASFPKTLRHRAEGRLFVGDLGNQLSRFVWPHVAQHLRGLLVLHPNEDADCR